MTLRDRIESMYRWEENNPNKATLVYIMAIAIVGLLSVAYSARPL